MPYTQNELTFFWQVAKGEATKDPHDTTSIDIFTDTELEQEMNIDHVRPYSDHDDIATAVDVRRTRENPDAQWGLWQ